MGGLKDSCWLRSGWNRRHAGESAGPEPSAYPKRPDLAVCWGPGSSGCDLRLHADAGAGRAGRISEGFQGISAGRCLCRLRQLFYRPARGLVEVGCWAHARRHFHNALEKDQARMGGVLAMIAHLYEVEKAAGKRTARRRPASGAGTRCAADADQLHEYLLTIRDRCCRKRGGPGDRLHPEELDGAHPLLR